MKQDLRTQLGSLQLDFSAYGKLPIREDVLLAGTGDGPLMKQWEKLFLLRKNLAVLNKYIGTNKGEKIAEWLKNNNEGMSDVVLKAIGGHNDETGGISAYFFNLQNFYDEQEGLYDRMEASEKFPDDVKRLAAELRRSRYEKRGARRVIRKAKLKDMKADNKGYLKYDIEEPPAAVESEGAPKVDEGKKKPDAPVTAEPIKKFSKNIKIAIAGTLILVAVVGFVASRGDDGK